MSHMKTTAYLFFCVLLILAKSEGAAFVETFKAFVTKPVVFASSNKNNLCWRYLFPGKISQIIDVRLN